MDIGAYFKGKRLERGLKLHEAADHVGLSERTIGDVERNENKPSWRTFMELLRFYNVSLCLDTEIVTDYSFGLILNAKRKANKQTLNDISKATGVYLTTISTYERGEQFPKFDTLERLAQALGLELELIEN